jgi:hypothetical protein
MTILIIFSAYGCSHSPESLKVLAYKPMSRTLVTEYPNIEEIYASDKEVVIVSCWGNISRSENHALKWEIIDNDGNIILTDSKENQTIYPNSFYTKSILLDDSTRNYFRSGLYTVNFYIDDKLEKSQSFKYTSKNVINKNVQGAVILPFKSSSQLHRIAERFKDVFSNTVSISIFSEVKRIIPDIALSFYAPLPVPWRYL